MKKSIVQFINLLSEGENSSNRGEIYVISIAIDDYDYELKLDYCKRDSEYLIEVIRHKSFVKIKQKNIYRLYDKEATKRNIYQSFRNLRRILTSNDQLIIHVAGHTNHDFRTNFFVPCDGDRNDLFTTISNSYLREFINATRHSSCILILNVFNEGHHSSLVNERQTASDEEKLDISPNKISIYSDLIRFLETSEKYVDKSIWHFATSTGPQTSRSMPIEVVEDTRELRKYLNGVKNELDVLIESGNFNDALKKVINISKNNDPRIRDQAEALLHYLKLRREDLNLVKPITKTEAEGLTKNLVHQVHESGYYVVPTSRSLQNPIVKPDVKVILYTSADTADQPRLRLSEEYHAINLELLRSKFRDDFELVPCFSSRISDLQRLLLEKEPYIVHFSGHGKCIGICMVADESGVTQVIKNEPLGRLFKLFSNSVECVFLNSCHSSNQSQAIGKFINNVVCMSNAILDETAIKFASAFYMSLGGGKDIPFSFEFAKNAIDLHGCSDKDLPMLLERLSA